jgi:hypothetical protein
MSSGVCTVTGCTQHGLFFKRLDRHLKRVHPGITSEQLKNFPKPDPEDRSIKQKSSKDRHIRRPYLVPGCRYFNVAVSRLSDHLRRQHAMTIDEHKALYNSRDASSDPVEAKAIKPITITDFLSTLPGACLDWESQK